MVKFLAMGSIYIGSVFFLLYFFSASYYNDNPGIVEYRNNINNFYDQLIARLTENNIKVSKLFNKKSYIASFYRHRICKKYLKNAAKLQELGFSDEDISFYQENISPIHKVRNTMFVQANTASVCFAIGFLLIVAVL